MAINFRPDYFNQVERPTPGETISPAGPENETVKMVRIRSLAPDGQTWIWTYYPADDPALTPEVVSSARQNGRIEEVDIPRQWGVQSGYQEPIANQPPAQGIQAAGGGGVQPAVTQAATPAPVATPEPAAQPAAPAAPATPPAAPPAAAPASPIAPPSNWQGNTRGDLRADKQPATGRWIRVTDPSDPNSGDEIGIDIAREDSEVGQEAIRNNRAVYPIPFANIRHATNGTTLDPRVATSRNFQVQATLLGSDSVADWKLLAPNSPENQSNHEAWDVTFNLKGGVGQITYRFQRTENATGRGESMQMTSSGGLKLNPDKKSPELEKADIEYRRAQQEQAQASAALSRAQAAGQPGQQEQTALENANKRLDLAEREFNLRVYGRAASTKDLTEDALRTAQTRGTEASTAATLQGVTNQTYQNVLQYYRDVYGDEAKALEMTMAFFNNRANVDQANNRTALDAARAQVDAENTANTQRTSLANTRLAQANQGYSDDLARSLDLNAYQPEGSNQGFLAFQAMQALRYANAQKWGGFAITDDELKPDPRRLPTGIAAFANPSNPSFATYPDLPGMLSQAQAVSNHTQRAGTRPEPPSHTNVVQPVVTQPPATNRPLAAGGQTTNPTPGAAARPANGPGATQAAPPNEVNAPITPAGTSSPPGIGSGLLRPSQAEPADVVTVIDIRDGSERSMSAAEYNSPLNNDARSNWQIQIIRPPELFEQQTGQTRPPVPTIPPQDQRQAAPQTAPQSATGEAPPAQSVPTPQPSAGLPGDPNEVVFGHTPDGSPWTGKRADAVAAGVTIQGEEQAPPPQQTSYPASYPNPEPVVPAPTTPQGVDQTSDPQTNYGVPTYSPTAVPDDQPVGKIFGPGVSRLYVDRPAPYSHNQSYLFTHQNLPMDPIDMSEDARRRRARAMEEIIKGAYGFPYGERENRPIDVFY